MNKEFLLKTNDLKSGDQIRLRNGWTAVIHDNMKGQTRLAMVNGYERELGSIYSHDIVQCLRPDGIYGIEHTPKQIALRNMVSNF
jgi:hypothetical protein